MSSFPRIMIPALGGTLGMFTLAYVVADQLVTDIPAPIRDTQIVAQAQAQEAPAEGAADAAEAAAGEATAETAADEAAAAAPADTAAAEAETAAGTTEAAADMAAGEVPPDGSAEVPVASSGDPVPDHDGTYGLGREALPEEVAAWDIDIRPDGTGLPEGSGDVWTGEELFVEKCAACHGDFGEGAGRWPQLAMGQGTLQARDPVKTVGSYWPYLSTVWDYVHRAMPFGEAQSLTADEVYALTAYILYLNEIVGDDFELSKATFTEVVMPNQDGFFMDDRMETEIPVFSQEVCMEDCRDSVEIDMRAAVLDVTPGDDSDGAPTPEAATTDGAAAPAEGEGTAMAAAETGTADTAAPDAPAAEPETTVAAEAEAVGEAEAEPDPDPALVAEGERAFRRCASCHQVGEGAVNRTGPQLNGIHGRVIGSVEGFRYSGVFQEAHDAGRVWDEDSLSAFLADPRGTMSGTKMSFAGVRSQEEIDAILAYLAEAGAD